MQQPTKGAMVGRALRLRCPVCGVGPMFRGLTQRAFCPHCGFRFEREVGYFSNALIINYTIVSLPILLVIAPLAFFSGLSLVTLLVAGVLIAVIVPVLTFPLSKALWLAFDVAIRPPEPSEFAPLPSSTHEAEASS